MKRYILFIVLFLITCIIYTNSLYAQNSNTEIGQKLAVIYNSMMNGGEFKIEYQIKGTNLTSANTLASLNADISYDSNSIRFISGSDWNPAINSFNGYSSNIKSNPADTGSKRWLRISILAPNLNADGSGLVTGFNIPVQYTAIVRLNFLIIDNTKSVTLSVKNETNQAGLFLNPSNSPNTFEIADQILQPPENIYEQPLPVNLASFSASVKGRDAVLEWKTSFEENNSGFNLERKNSKDNKWSVIAFISGKINANTVTDYNYCDKKLATGEYYYRLKQIDLNGNYNYYDLADKINIGIPDKFSISQNYPNPFNSATKIDIDLPEHSNVKLYLYDITGREISRIINNGEYQSGYYTIDYNAGNLPSGTYFYRIFVNDLQTADRKMIILK
jgi:hypothetical protein